MTLPPLPDDGTLSREGLAPAGRGRALVIACGALAREILALIRLNGWEHMDLQCLPAEVDPCAEAGEFHTCVSAGPMFARRIPVEVGEVVRRDGFVFADLTLAAG